MGRRAIAEIQPLLTPAQVAEFLGISRRQVLRLPIRRTTLGPKSVRYRMEDIDAYIEEKTTD